MARAKKEKTPKKKAKGGADLMSSPGRTKGIEALGVLAMTLAGALVFALASFDPTDHLGHSNMVGPVGAAVARFLISGIGVLGYVFVGAVGLLAGAMIVGKARWPRPLAFFGVLGMTAATTTLAHLALGGDTVFGYSSGGVVGAFSGELLRSFIGPAGAGLVASCIFAVCLLGVADMSFGNAMKDTGRGLKWLGLQIWGRVDIWRAANEAARLREAEVLAGEEVRKVEVASKRDQKERALIDKLEDKKRLAIIKARAKAEERALAKIAADEAKARIKEEEQQRLEAEEQERARREEEERIRQAEEQARIEEEARALHEAELQAQAEAAVRREEAAAEQEQPPEEEPKIEISVKETSAQEIASLQDDEEGDSHQDEDEDEYEYEEGEDEYEEGEECLDDGEEEDELEYVSTTPEQIDGPQIVDRVPDGPNQDVMQSDGALNIKLSTRTPKREYRLPPLKHLDYDAPDREPLDSDFLKGRASRLEEKLKTYGVDGKVVKIRPGPVVTTYEYQPAPGVKVSKIAGLSDDIAMSMEARSVRIIAPIPGRGVVGIELPNKRRETVYLREIIAHNRFLESKSLLTIAMGKDAEGDAQVANLAKMPHCLIAGTTGSGKSVSTNAMILSILYKATPDQVKFIMVDPKMLELSLYEGIPHLLLPVVTDAKKASLALQWAVDEMERRYKMLSEFKVRSIDGFNQKLELLRKQREADSCVVVDVTDEDDLIHSEVPVEVAAAKGKRIQDLWRGEDLPDEMPYIVILIDEFADLMCVAPRDVEQAVQRLAQKARAAGIHLIIATQRPSTDVITGVIKNNLPTRMSFRVASRHDSATVINAPGAENLLGMGDMLYLSNASPTTTRIHGAYVTEEEVQRVAEFWKEQGAPCYDPEILKPRSDTDDDGDEDEDLDVMYDQAVKIVTDTRKASISGLQRRLRVGYNRAARMIEAMERHGIVSEPTGPKAEREILVSKIASPNEMTG
jgi:DNA segregation ATPase FtsK/SpoIIIE, S-DNA-T family